MYYKKYPTYSIFKIIFKNHLLKEFIEAFLKQRTFNPGKLKLLH